MRYFTIDELIRSDTAYLKGIDNTPSKEIITNLTLLIENLLDPIRESWGSPLYITSGYRSPQLNKAVGGSINSDHLKGFAADLKPLNGKMDIFQVWLINLLKTNETAFKQLIIEKPINGIASWIHLSWDPLNNKRQILTL